ncbi:MAG: hypothetical protein ABW005_16060, partial [Burkholderiaceae bacterium]
MRRSNRWSLLAASTAFAAIAAVALAACVATPGGKSGMSFFVTSAGPGNGGNLGGLAGADQQCQMLAANVGAGGRKWRAYLSTQPTTSQPGVNARDRIGRGPWQNAKGVVVATDLA